MLAPLYLYLSSLLKIKWFWINLIDKGELIPGKETSRYVNNLTENGKKKWQNWHTKPIHIWHTELKSSQIPGCLINIRRSQNKRYPQIWVDHRNWLGWSIKIYLGERRRTGRIWKPAISRTGNNLPCTNACCDKKKTTTLIIWDNSCLEGQSKFIFAAYYCFEINYLTIVDFLNTFGTWSYLSFFITGSSKNVTYKGLLFYFQYSLNKSIQFVGDKENYIVINSNFKALISWVRAKIGGALQKWVIQA